jgi:hypothetical protein
MLKTVPYYPAWGYVSDCIIMISVASKVKTNVIVAGSSAVGRINNLA